MDFLEVEYLTGVLRIVKVISTEGECPVDVSRLFEWKFLYPEEALQVAILLYQPSCQEGD